MVGLSPMVNSPQLVRCSFLQPEPLLSWKGFPRGKEDQSSQTKLVPRGPWLQTSPLHVGSRVSHCLGWQKAQDTVRGWQDPSPHRGSVCIWARLYMHTMGNGRLTRQRATEQGAGAMRPLLGDPQLLGLMGTWPHPFFTPTTSRKFCQTHAGPWFGSLL